MDTGDTSKEIHQVRLPREKSKGKKWISIYICQVTNTMRENEADKKNGLWQGRIIWESGLLTYLWCSSNTSVIRYLSFARSLGFGQEVSSIDIWGTSPAAWDYIENVSWWRTTGVQMKQETTLRQAEWTWESENKVWKIRQKDGSSGACILLWRHQEAFPMSKDVPAKRSL